MAEIKVHGLDAIQLVILNLLLNPQPLYDSGEKLNAVGIGKFLNKSDNAIARAMRDEALLAELHRISTERLNVYRASIDSALIESAMTKGPHGHKDRKLYYELIGEVGPNARTDTPPGDTLTREQKLRQIEKFFQHINHNLPRSIVHAGSKDERPAPAPAQGAMGENPVPGNVMQEDVSPAGASRPKGQGNAD